METTLVCYKYCCILFNLITVVLGVTCSFGSVNYIDESTCYWLTTQSLSNTLSNDNCKKDGGVLANIPDQNAWNVLTTQMQSKGETIAWYSGIWIGITDQENEGVFKTMKGVDQLWFNWKTGEPSDVSHSFNCVKLLPKDPVEPFTYDDRDCSEDSIALCYLLTAETTTSTTMENISQTEMSSSALITETVPSSTDEDIQTTYSSAISYISDSVPTDTKATSSSSSSSSSSSTTTTTTVTTTTASTTTSAAPSPPPTTTTGYVSSKNSNTDTSQLSSSNFAPSIGYSNIQTTAESFSSASIAMATSLETVRYEDGTTASPLITSEVSAIVTEENYNRSCLCVCKNFGLSAEQLQRRIQEIVEILTIPKKSTSASRRRLISAPDDRASARSLGYFGAAILVTVAGLIVFLDLTSVCRQIDLLKNYHKSVGRRNTLQLNRHSRKTEFLQNEIW